MIDWHREFEKLSPDKHQEFFGVLVHPGGGYPVYPSLFRGGVIREVN